MAKPRTSKAKSLMMRVSALVCVAESEVVEVPLEKHQPRSIFAASRVTVIVTEYNKKSAHT